MKSEITSCNERISDIEARNALLDDSLRPSSFDVSNEGDDDKLSILVGDEFGVHQDATSHLLADKPSVAVSRPTEETIKPPDTANKPTENPLPVEQVTLDSSSCMYFEPEVPANSWSPSPKFHSFLEKQFRRKLSFKQSCDILEEQAIPAVDALCAPTLDPSVINHIRSHNKKFVQERDKELSVIQRAILNTTGPSCSLHDRLENNVAIDPVGLMRVVEQTLCLLGSANTQLSILRMKKVLANVNKTKIDLANHNQDLPNAKKWLLGDDFRLIASKEAELARGLAKNLGQTVAKNIPKNG